MRECSSELGEKWPKLGTMPIDVAENGVDAGEMWEQILSGLGA